MLPFEEERYAELMRMKAGALRAHYLKISGRRRVVGYGSPHSVLSKEVMAQLVILYERRELGRDIEAGRGGSRQSGP